MVVVRRKPEPEVYGDYNNPDYILGVDIGQSHDPTAITICEQMRWLSVECMRDMQIDLTATTGRWIAAGDYDPRAMAQIADYAEQHGRPVQVPLSVVQVRRLPLHMAYPDIISELKGLFKQATDGQRTATSVVDATGVGRPVFDELVRSGVSTAGVILTGGVDVRYERGLFRVPKPTLIDAAKVAVQNHQVTLINESPELDVLKDELLTYRVRRSKSANEIYDAREGKHDDLVIAFSLPIWYRNWFLRFWDDAHRRPPEEKTTQEWGEWL